MSADMESSKQSLNKSVWMVALAGFILLAASGCSSVVSKRPVGEKQVRIVAKDWEGDWRTHDGTVRVKVIDAEKGILKAFWLEDDKQGNPGMRTARIELRESGNWLFANTEDDKGRGYVWGRIKNEDRQIVVWSPNDKVFSKLITDGVFPGKVESGEVALEELKPQHLKIITSGEKGVLFLWDEPTVFLKVGN